MAICILLSLQVLVPRQFARVCRIVNMDECVKENCVAVIALHKLKPLKISQNFVYQAIKRYKKLWRVDDRAWSGRLEGSRRVWLSRMGIVMLRRRDIGDSLRGL